MKVLVLAVLPAFLLLSSEPQTTLNGSLVQNAGVSPPAWLLVPQGMDIATAERKSSEDLRWGRLRLPVRGDSAAVFEDLAIQYQSQGFVTAQVMDAQSQPGRPHRMLTAWEPASGRQTTMLGVKTSLGDTLLITYQEAAGAPAPDVPIP